jgi:serine/threonine-protein kinase HipA
MTIKTSEDVSVLKLTLHNKLVGYLLGSRGGKNVFSFAPEFRLDSNRPTFSLITHPAFPKADMLLATPWSSTHRLHPTLSNLLPEGALRELIAQGLKVHPDNEFQIFGYLGADLPGALVAEPVAPADIPESLLRSAGNIRAVNFEKALPENKFSLAGVQMKFSMKEHDGRYNFAAGNELGDWIIKTPSTKHQDVPLNEYTAMRLASLVGIDIPEIKLVKLSHLENLPQINLPDEKLAFAIKRFDRNDDQRIHMEDFAQILVKYPHEKYNSASYEQIGRIIYAYSGEGLTDAQQFARRLLVNILLANGDAHLKNWSLLYANQITARLSPAYDIVTTRVYFNDETQFAMSLGKTKEWYNVSLKHFQVWAERADIPWRSIKPHLDDVMQKARQLWPEALRNLPMNEEHKQKLVQHWQALQPDFKI